MRTEKTDQTVGFVMLRLIYACRIQSNPKFKNFFDKKFAFNLKLPNTKMYVLVHSLNDAICQEEGMCIFQRRNHMAYSLPL